MKTSTDRQSPLVQVDRELAPPEEGHAHEEHVRPLA
jgi:hypothetical protein